MLAAPKIVLNDKAVAAMVPAPKGKRRVVWDAAQPNLCVRVTDKGRRTFIVVHRKAGDPKPVWHVLGTHPALSVVKARKAASEALGFLTRGKHPKEAEEERLRNEALRRRDTFGVVADEFIRRHVSKLRSAAEAEAIIRRELLGQRKVVDAWVAAPGGSAKWRDRAVTTLTRRDVVELLEGIVDRGVPAQARKTFAAARKIFSWAIQRDTYGLNQSPCTHINANALFGPPKARTRVLTDEELAIVWHVAHGLGYPFGSLTQILMLTGQRLREISAASWVEMPEGKEVLVIPAERMKGKVAHTVPLTPKVTELLDALPRFEKTEGSLKGSPSFVFTTTNGERPVSGFSKAKARLDRGIAKLIDKLRAEGQTVADFPAWDIHDLRRTVRTRLSSLGILPVVAELVIGHKQTGIHAVYDLHRYDAEKRDALERWEKQLLGMIGRLTAHYRIDATKDD